jgi:glutathione synthase/RimK-type ligase-like ATP-grasp enzyme
MTNREQSKTSKRCAFLTMDNLHGFVSDDQLAIEPLRSLGWEVEFVPWTAEGVDWQQYDAVLPRTTWDYHHHLQQFLKTLESIAGSGTLLANNVEMIRWNSHKSYLLELRNRGVPIVPTLIGRTLTQDGFPRLFRDLRTDKLIIKPAVGANADFTYPIERDTPYEAIAEICTVYKSRDFLAQEFVASVTSEGEYSLFYFNGRHSHTILKTPKSGDFRVQEEHGGVITSVAADEELLAAGIKTMSALNIVPLYARADFVRGSNSGFLLMELELIEPALYFRTDPDSALRFARALDEWVGGRKIRAGSPEDKDLIKQTGV